MVNAERMLSQLELHEGLKTEVYLDTMGNETLGIGYNVAARGLTEFEHTVGRRLEPAVITPDEARRQCALDIVRVEKAVIVHWPFYLQLDPVRQRVALDMAFNLGLRALAFKQTIACCEKRDWSGAYRNLFQSKWAYQVDDGEGKRFGRADRLGQMLLTGREYAL